MADFSAAMYTYEAGRAYNDIVLSALRIAEKVSREGEISLILDGFEQNWWDDWDAQRVEAELRKALTNG